MAGCLSAADQMPADPPIASASFAPDPWAEGDRILLAEWEHIPGVAPPNHYVEFSVLCLMGGGPSIAREGGFVENGTDHIEMVLQVDPLTNLGIQVGYAIDAPEAADGNDPEGRIHWLPPVWGGTVVHHIILTPDLWETEQRERWTFHARVNPGDDSLCYTGAAWEDYGVRIEAVRTPSDGHGCARAADCGGA